MNRLSLVVAIGSIIVSTQPGLAAGSDATVNAAYKQLSVGRAQTATQMLAPIVKAEPENVAARRLLGYALARSGRESEALQHMTAVLNSSQSTAADHSTCGHCYLSLGAHNKAADHFKKALQIDAQESSAICGLAQTYANSGDYAQAKTLCERSLRQGLDERTRRHLSNILNQLEPTKQQEVTSG